MTCVNCYFLGSIVCIFYWKLNFLVKFIYFGDIYLFTHVSGKIYLYVTFSMFCPFVYVVLLCMCEFLYLLIRVNVCACCVVLLSLRCCWSVVRASFFNTSQISMFMLIFLHVCYRYACSFICQKVWKITMTFDFVFSLLYVSNFYYFQTYVQ